MTAETEYQRVQKAIWLLTRAMAGFEESNLYDDYKEYEGFTDEEWADAWNTLERFAGKEPSKAPA